MRRLRRRLTSLARWLGFPGAERLAGTVAVLSPHLDDAVFSLGGAIAAARPAEVAIVTMLAGDPDSELPSGRWDADAGFRTAGEAARERRREDALACADLGARPIWLPFGDHQYERPADAAVWAALEKAVQGFETILVPGFPLMHEDHVWLVRLVERNGFSGRRVAHYVEQPYAAAWTARPLDGSWMPLAAGLPHRLAKLRACRRYASQLPLLERRGRVLARLVAYEAGKGGECVRWT